MKHTLESLIELEDYLKELDESVGLDPASYNNITEAIEKKKVEINKCSIDHVSGCQNPMGCACKEANGHELTDCPYFEDL